MILSFKINFFVLLLEYIFIYNDYYSREVRSFFLSKLFNDLVLKFSVKNRLDHYTGLKSDFDVIEVRNDLLY
jgi:hypothetical protein